MFFRPRFKITNAPPKEVAFFYEQYVQVMKHGEDKVDSRLKRYLFEILISLGVPHREMYLDLPEEEPEEVELIEKDVLLVHRKDRIEKVHYERKHNGERK